MRSGHGVLQRQDLTYAEAGQALDVLSAWVPRDTAAGALHPGDVGWLLRFDDATVHLWANPSRPVAVAISDGATLRVMVEPGFDATALIDDVELLTAGEDAWCDGLDALLGRGWVADPDESWLVLHRPAPQVSGFVPDLPLTDVADRVAVQRAAFEGSTFTVERWRAMRGSPAGDRCVEVLIRTPHGEPAAAVTGWLAGPGRCALIEPMGTHRSFRGRGYGRAALQRACEALAARGASSIAVVTPVTNTAAVALYKSAGFTVVASRQAVTRPRRA